MRDIVILLTFMASLFMNSASALSDRLAVLPCDLGARVEASVKEAKILIHDTLINQARKFTSMTIITRENVWTVLKDKGIDPEKCGEGKCAVDNGRILQANKIITCSISKPGATYYIFLNYYETASAKLIDSKRKEVRGGVDDVIKALEALAEELFRGEKIGEGDAKLYIVTKTPEVEFEVDEGEISGKVVDKKIVYLSPGSHRIKFSKTGYQSLKEEFFAEAGRVKTIEVELFPEVKEVKKEEGSGMLDIVTEPDGAEIYLDGEKVKNPDGSSILTPNTLVDVPAGEHIVLLKKPLYKNMTKRVYISPGTVEKLRVKLEENYGLLNVETEPAGATVYLDGTNRGETPYSEDRLQAKAYILEVKLPNYHDYKETLYVKPKEKTIRVIKLQPAFGSLKVTGVKGAKVFLDAQEIGEVPFFQKIVSPGWHWLEVRHPLYKPMRQRVEVEEGKTQNVNAELEPYFGYLTVESNVKDAPIKIDGETVGYGSIKEYVIRAGEHRLTVGDPEKYRVWDQKIAIGVLEKKRVIANPRPRLGTLLLASVPGEADVYVDGEGKGKTPVALKLIQGEHKIVLKKAGYASVEKRINIKEGEVVRLKLRIPKYKPAYITVYLKPSGELYINGEKAGEGSEIRAKIPSNERVTIEAKKHGYFTKKEEIFLKENEDRTLRLTLREKPPLGVFYGLFGYNHTTASGVLGGGGISFFVAANLREGIWFAPGLSVLSGQANLNSKNGTFFSINFPLEIGLGYIFLMLEPFIYRADLGSSSWGGGFGLGGGICFMKKPFEIKAGYIYNYHLSGARLTAGWVF